MTHRFDDGLQKYNHPEAFCLMTYATDDRSVVERVWNSRDGVTPFIIHTRDGAQEMTHVDRAADHRVPSHLPKVGDRIFVDLTMERAIEFATKFIEHWWDHAKYPMRESYEDKATAIRALAHESMRQGIGDMTPEDLIAYGSGPPDLVVVNEERLAAITARRPPAPPWVPRRFA